jgi:uncharacterized surface protein with fasciclin (FAS1) repeats
MSDRVNLVETIAKIDTFSTFARMMRTSNANVIFDSDGPFTVFVPTNDAFGKIPDAQMNGLLSENGQARLKQLLSYHIVPGKLFVSNLESAGTVKSVSGLEMTFTDIGGIKVNNSGMQARNIEATNGMVHGLDTVLTPPAIETASVAGTPSTKAFEEIAVTAPAVAEKISS